MHVTLTTQEAEIRKIKVQSQLRPTIQETLSPENPSQKRADGVTQGVGPSSNPSTTNK
jgi:hypothetical protein